MEKEKKQSTYKVGQLVVLLTGITICCNYYPAGTIARVIAETQEGDGEVKLEMYNEGDTTWRPAKYAIRPINTRRGEKPTIAKQLFEESTYSNLAKF